MPPSVPASPDPQTTEEPGITWLWTDYGGEDPGEPSARSTPSHGRTPHPGRAVTASPESTLGPQLPSPPDELLPVPEMVQEAADRVVNAIGNMS